MNNFTEEEITTAKKVRDALINGELSEELQAVYMAGEIVMWDEIRESPSTDVSVLLKGFEKIIGIVKRYRDYDGETSIGNHIENECKEILAQYSTPTGEAEKGETKRDPFIEKHLTIIWEKTKEAQIERFIKPMFDSLSAASIKHFIEKGTINGGFLIALNSMMEAVKNWKSGEIKMVAPADEIDASISEGEERRLNRQEDQNELLGKCLNMLRFLYMNEYCGDHGAEVRELITPKPHRKQ